MPLLHSAGDLDQEVLKLFSSVSCWGGGLQAWTIRAGTAGVLQARAAE